MKTSPFWASIALANTVLAQGLRQATGGTDTGTPVPWYPSPSPEVSDCEASLITKLCDYKKPGPEFAVASSGKKHCWEYCNDHQPCNFVIFATGNPYTGTGTCWLYPGETFDESLGEGGCEYLHVYDKPDCGDATPTAGDCAATASPSAIAEVCDYPTPDDDCWSTCSASMSSSACLSQCVESDSCSYAVFNPQSESGSPHAPGTCWMYPSGKYDPKKAGTCSGAAEQFVYENPCPKPPKPSSTTSSSTATSTPSGGRGSSPEKGGDESSQSSSDPSPSASGSPNDATAEGAQAGGDAKKDDPNGAAPAGIISLGGLVAVGMAVLLFL